MDINQGWDVNRAITAGREMAEHRLYWLEDPTHFQDYAGLARIADALDTPIAAGEYAYGIEPFRHMLEARSIDIVMVDLLRAGGITQWMKIAHMAEAYNLPVGHAPGARDTGARAGSSAERPLRGAHAVGVPPVRGGPSSGCIRAAST